MAKVFSNEGNYLVPIFGGIAMPSVGSYNQGAYYLNTAPSIQGTAGSKYIIKGWVRVTTGNAHVLNTDWVVDKVLTGS